MGFTKKKFYFLKIILRDCDSNGAVLFRLVALVDNDEAGRSLRRSLLQQYRSFRENRDLFVLRRILPRTTSEPSVLTSQIAKHNAPWTNIDCELEDLLGNELITAFLADEPNSLTRPVQSVGQHDHYEWKGPAKARLCMFVERYAQLGDMTGIVEVLKSLRFYLGLPVDGVT